MGERSPAAGGEDAQLLRGERNAAAPPPPTEEANPRKVFVGGLPQHGTEQDLHDEFRRFGKILHIQFKGRFGFVEYEEEESARMALEKMKEGIYLGERIQVHRHNPAIRSVRGPPAHQVTRPFAQPNGPRPTAPREKRTEYKVYVFNLDDRVSWQDLKDFGRNAGEVNFANVFSKGNQKIGLIEYGDSHTMHLALDRLQRLKLYEKRVHVERDKGQLDGVHQHAPDQHGDTAAVGGRSRSVPYGDASERGGGNNGRRRRSLRGGGFAFGGGGGYGGGGYEGEERGGGAHCMPPPGGEGRRGANSMSGGDLGGESGRSRHRSQRTALERGRPSSRSRSRGPQSPPAYPPPGGPHQLPHYRSSQFGGSCGARHSGGMHPTVAESGNRAAAFGGGSSVQEMMPFSRRSSSPRRPREIFRGHDPHTDGGARRKVSAGPHSRGANDHQLHLTYDRNAPPHQGQQPPPHHPGHQFDHHHHYPPQHHTSSSSSSRQQHRQPPGPPRHYHSREEYSVSSSSRGGAHGGGHIQSAAEGGHRHHYGSSRGGGRSHSPRTTRGSWTGGEAAQNFHRGRGDVQLVDGHGGGSSHHGRSRSNRGGFEENQLNHHQSTQQHHQAYRGGGHHHHHHGRSSSRKESSGFGGEGGGARHELRGVPNGGGYGGGGKEDPPMRPPHASGGRR